MHKQMENLSMEQMREIVEGAPGRAEVCIPCLEDVMYFAKRDDGKWFKWSNGYNQWLEYFGKVDPMDLAMDLNDLRTAIAKHDEFKVGDLVVYRKQCNLIWDGVYRVDAVLADGRVIERDLPTPKEWLSHATPSEIKAGHRLEAEHHG